MKIYTQRLAQQWNTVQINDNKYNGEAITFLIIREVFVNRILLGLLKDIPNPEILLASNQNLDEIAMVCFVNYIETFGNYCLFILDQEFRKRSRSSCERYESRE